MKIYVVAADYGCYEGWLRPCAAFSTREKAALFIVDFTDYQKTELEIVELELDQSA